MAIDFARFFFALRLFLPDVTRMSSTLSYESKKYQKNAKALSRQALIKKYMPFAIIGGVFFLVLFFRYLFY